MPLLFQSPSTQSKTPHRCRRALSKGTIIIHHLGWWTHVPSSGPGNRAPRPHSLRDWFLARPRWPRAMWSKLRPDRADVAPIEPTDLARPRPRVTQSFFTVRSAILIKHQLFLSFRSIILLHCCYSAQLFLFQCSAISENSIIFSLLQWTRHFSYRAQSFYDFVRHSATVLHCFWFLLQSVWSFLWPCQSYSTAIVN
jgi:hypothetical protein